MKVLNRRQIIGYTGLMTVATFLTGAINFVFNMVVGRLIGPQEYGILGPLMGSFFSLVSLPMMGLQLFMNQSLGEMSQHHPGGLRSFIGALFVNLMKLLVGVEVVLWGLFPVWMTLFRVPNHLLMMILFVMVMVNYVQIFVYTLLQFHHEFGVIFWVTVGTTLAKLGLGVGLGWWFRSSTAVMLAYLLPMVVGTGVYVASFWPWYTRLPEGDFVLPEHFWRSLVVSMLSGGAYMALSSFDMLLVRVFFVDQVQVGIYAMAGLMARASFFVASAFTTVFLPVMSREKHRSLRLTLWGLVLLFGLLVGYTVGVWVFRFFIARVLLGGVYPGLETYMVVYTLCFLPYALISFLVSFYTVRRSWVYSVSIAIGMLLQVGLFFFFHESLAQALMIVGGVGYGLLVWLLMEMVIQERRV